MKGFLYILQSRKNNRYYIGSTVDVERRLAEHRAGKTKSLKPLLPIKLVFVKEYPEITMARKMEFRLKRMKSRVLVEKIIHKGDILMGL